MNILKIIFAFFTNNKTVAPGVDNAPGVFPGVIFDERTDEEKKNDVSFGEIVAKAEAVDWKEKPESEWRMFGVQNQNGQSSCVGHAGRKALRVLFHTNHSLDVDFSALDIYRRRSNYPDGGMAAWDLWNILTGGTTLAQLLPSDGFSEAHANAVTVPTWMRTVGNVFKIMAGVNLPMNDIDAVASVIQRTGKGVVLFYYFTQTEWSRKDPRMLAPHPDLYSSSSLKHAVTAVDHTLIGGVKHLVIEDSAHFGGLSRRVISEDFHRARCFYAGYPMNFVFGPAEKNKPQHNFTREIVFGETSDEVKALQECLKYEGVFPSNVSSSGYYGSVTALAILAFQMRYAVASLITLEQLAGRNVGPATRVALNKRFA